MLTNDEAWALIKSSAPYQNSGGDMNKAILRWRASNEGEFQLYSRYCQDLGAAPSLKTKFGIGVVAIVENMLDRNPTPAPPPVPPVSPFAGKGAFLQFEGAATPAFMQEGGISKVAPQLTSVGSDNAATFSNYTNLKAGDTQRRWAGIAEICAWGTHGANPVQEAEHIASRIDEFGIHKYLADTERHWLSGMPWLTETLLLELNRLIGNRCEVGLISFGFSEHSQGAVANSGYATAVKYGADFMPEGYDADGHSYGMVRFMTYLSKEIIQRPYVIAIGDKDVAVDVLALKQYEDWLDGVWVWVAEQAGDSVKSMKALSL